MVILKSSKLSNLTDFVFIKNLRGGEFSLN